MKKKLAVLSLSLVMVFCFSANAFASVSVDNNSWIAKNKNSSFSVLVDYTGETAPLTAFWTHGLYCSWGKIYEDTATSKIQELVINVDENSSIGANSIFIAPSQAEVPDGSFAFINVYVTDQSEIEISNIKKANKKVKVTWTNGKSGFYQLQYREKNGSWKNASDDYISKSSFSFAKLKKGKTYSFRVRCVTPAPVEFYGATWDSGDKIGNYIYGPWSDKFSYKVK